MRDGAEHSSGMAVAATVTFALVVLVGIQFVLLGILIELRSTLTSAGTLVLIAISGLCLAASLALARALH